MQELLHLRQQLHLQEGVMRQEQLVEVHFHKFLTKPSVKSAQENQRWCGFFLGVEEAEGVGGRMSGSSGEEAQGDLRPVRSHREETMSHTKCHGGHRRLDLDFGFSVEILLQKKSISLI